MYSTKFLQGSSNKYLLRLIGNFIGLVVVLNISSCNWRKGGQNNTAGISIEKRIGMTIPQTLLIGNENKIEVAFQVDSSGNCAVLGDFKLKVSILEQSTFRGPTTGSQIRYESAANGEQKFSESFEKSLTEFANLVKLDQNNQTSGLKVDFDLLPAVEANEVIRLKLNFELLDMAGNSIRSIDVEWIKSEIIITPPTQFKGKEASFTLKNLKEGIKDLSKIIINIQSTQNNVFFLVRGSKSFEATLAELLPGTSEIAKDQESTSIRIVTDNISDQGTVFSILAFASDAVSVSPLVRTKELHNPNLGTNSGIEQGVEERKQEQLEKQEPNQLKQAQKAINEIKQADNKSKVEGGPTRKEKIEKLENGLKKFNQEGKEEVKSEDKEIGYGIEENYEKEKGAISTLEVRKSLKDRIVYHKGFMNAFAHNMFGTHLKDPRSFAYFEGQRAGHKASAVLSRTEATIGPTLVGVGLAGTIAGLGPTLGGITVVTIPLVALGGILLTHGAAISERTQANLTNDRGKVFVKKIVEVEKENQSGADKFAKNDNGESKKNFQIKHKHSSKVLEGKEDSTYPHAHVAGYEEVLMQKGS